MTDLADGGDDGRNAARAAIARGQHLFDSKPMNPSKKKMSPGWVFAAGALFGALSVLAPIASSGTSSGRAEASRHRYPPAKSGTESSAPRDHEVSLEADPPGPSHPAPVDSKKTRSGPPPQTKARHSELDLQLD